MAEDTTSETAAETPVEKGPGKSIIKPQYRGKYKTPDWLGTLLNDNASKVKTLPAQDAKAATGEIGKPGYSPAREAKPERTVIDGVDVDKLFVIGRENGLNLDKFEAQKGAHGFEGRFRMTVRNMLQTIAKQRHGLVINGTFVRAPQEFLTKVGVLEGVKPTHNPDGTKIPKPAKVAEAETLPEGQPESKLIKADEAPPAAKETPPAPAKKKK